MAAHPVVIGGGSRNPIALGLRHEHLRRDARLELRDEIEDLAAAHRAQCAELERLPQRLLAQAFEPNGHIARSATHPF